jgi:hypothetical protein
MNAPADHRYAGSGCEGIVFRILNAIALLHMLEDCCTTVLPFRHLKNRLVLLSRKAHQVGFFVAAHTNLLYKSPLFLTISKPLNFPWA